MFGIIRPCRHRLPGGLAAEWMGHLCGLCLALRRVHGQAARTATNYDGLLISVLYEAQSAGGDARAGWRRAGPCPLRGMRTASVADGAGAQLAAAVSLVLASAKIRDHVADGDGALAHRPLAAAARRMASGWDRAGTRGGAGVGFDTAVLLEAVDRQQDVEALAGPGTPLLAVTEPTETATGAAFAHTAVLAGRPANATALAEAGRLFGRVAHLLDAVEDLDADRTAGAWNPITATGTPLGEVRRLCDDAVRGVRLALRDVEFADDRLAHVLLAHELDRAVGRAFDDQHLDAPPRRRGLVAGCAQWTWLFCTCQVCCRKQYEDPWNGQKRREGWCRKCDCGDACDCCDCCECGGGKSGGGCGDGCCCDCSP
ncbi:DUF5685 family protein [Streptomyces hainanensis]|uniref:DUF5685 family protein n=1 Tax=Streptomyces hainanensis TaxID=402648 RepID=UPI00140512A0|nr:DUF5685 family protein [Streptomyces hainanensis]